MNTLKRIEGRKDTRFNIELDHVVYLNLYEYVGIAHLIGSYSSRTSPLYSCIHLHLDKQAKIHQEVEIQLNLGYEYA